MKIEKHSELAGKVKKGAESGQPRVREIKM
jgi:hypothetical protein